MQRGAPQAAGCLANIVIRAVKNNRGRAKVIPCAANDDEYIAPRLQRPSGDPRTRPSSPGMKRSGEVAEWSKAHAWKVCRRGTVSRVRIPFSPPFSSRPDVALWPGIRASAAVGPPFWRVSAAGFLRQRPRCCTMLRFPGALPIPLHRLSDRLSPQGCVAGLCEAGKQ